ncbi:hypothetical protein E4U55_002293 [Claviceps digitariae]|nr:hypothetical protein E4U55_002293 [Claviceps digitariae]
MPSIARPKTTSLNKKRRTDASADVPYTTIPPPHGDCITFYAGSYGGRHMEGLDAAHDMALQVGVSFCVNPLARFPWQRMSRTEAFLRWKHLSDKVMPPIHSNAPFFGEQFSMLHRITVPESSTPGPQ